MKVFLICLFSLAGSFVQAKSAKDCGEFRNVEFSPAKTDFKMKDGSVVKDYDIKRAELGSFRLDAGDTPLLIFDSKSGKSCDVKVGIVTGDAGDVYALEKSGRALYRSYSGSTQWATLVDMKTCKKVWESRGNIGNDVTENSVEIKPDCGACEETAKFEGVCECDSAEVWKLTPDCGLKKDVAASKSLTKKILHVSFAGKRKVKGAKSESAKLVP